jgi:hypothetical protein
MYLEEMLANLREASWTVGIHNDYRQGGKLMTFWLFTHPDGRWLKGEAESDQSRPNREVFKGKTIVDSITVSVGKVERAHRTVE